MKKTIIVLFMLFTLFPAVDIYAEEKLYAASAEGFLILRLAPYESAPEITKVPACASLELIETNKTWGKVVFMNKCGWINLSFTADSYTNAANSSGVTAKRNVTVDSGNRSAVLYSLPSVDPVLGSEEKYTVPDKAVLGITRETKNGWSLADMNGKLAWIQTEFIKEFETTAEETEQYGISYVYTLSPGGTGVSLFESIGKKNVLATIPDCVKLTLREKRNGYYYVSYNGINGWILSRHTAKSYEYALNNAGNSVNEEYTVNGEGAAPLMSVPSEFVHDGSFPEGSVKPGETVFVLRCTEDGWSYISHSGKKGWISPGRLEPAIQTEVEKIELCTPHDVYIPSAEGKGLKLYDEADSEAESFVSVPSCVKMNIIAEKNDFGYAINNYAGGWVKLSETVSDYETALDLANAKLNVPEYYMIKKPTQLYSLPTYSEKCGSAPLLSLTKGVEFTVIKTVTTNEKKWGLTEIDGQMGWIRLSKSEKISFPFKYVLITASGIVAALFIIIYLYRRKKALG